MALIQPVILSGGSGTRLWPVSRVLLPKQLQALTSKLTMLQETALRVSDPSRFSPPIVISNEEHRFPIAAQLEEIGVKPLHHVLEPAGRNTAAACAIAAHLVSETDPKQTLLILPSDHLVTDTDRFVTGISTGAELAGSGAIVLFGIPATRPETGYGYIVRGTAQSGRAKSYKVDSFVEKPDMATAQELIAARNCYWNSGIFLMRADTLLDEMERLRPQIYQMTGEAVAHASRQTDFLRVETSSFLRTPSEPIDKAVMERSDRLCVLQAEFGWSDIGSWSALWDVSAKDRNGNAVLGDAMLLDSRNCFIRSERALIAAVGVDDTVIIEDGDAVLVCSKSHAQGVKELVERMRQQGRREQLNHLQVTRPWGRFETISAGANYQVKVLHVKPGAALSLQFHRRRAEHWVVVQGTAEVTLDGEAKILGPSEAIDIPLGVPHRLRNAGSEPLLVIEVQLGSYLGEDDIVRLEDPYRRAISPMT
ncbi:MAG: mannose-1-phosphate guanylyltransferase/mannose-6-phosphate isomerase [Alphaproteobacteria bacterium]|nr:mannose-1-phosphate guanylyltransferase/mannose-6-phosphate isomerase [Alphaproteobacteria bacterium]